MSSIIGTVIDSITKKGIPGIRVDVMQNGSGQSTGLSTTTDGKGGFDISYSPYVDGDNSVFFNFSDPSNAYYPATYPFSNVDNVSAELDPLQKTVGVPVLIGGILLFLVAAYFIFFKRSK